MIFIPTFLILLIIAFVAIFVVIIISKKITRTKKIIILSAITVFFILSIASFFYDDDNVEIATGVIYNKERKDILADYCSIAPEVLGYKRVDDFVLVRQSLRFPLDAIYDESKYEPILYDSIVYWFIDTEEGEEYGPMDFVEFSRYCHSKGVDDIDF